MNYLQSTIKVSKLKWIFGLILILCFANNSFAQRQGGATLNAKIKGHNVGMATVLSGQSQIIWDQVGEKKWERIETVNKSNGQKGFYLDQATETHRDEWSVYVTCNAQKYRIDLWQKRVYNLSEKQESFSDIIAVEESPESWYFSMSNVRIKVLDAKDGFQDDDVELYGELVGLVLKGNSPLYDTKKWFIKKRKGDYITIGERDSRLYQAKGSVGFVLSRKANFNNYAFYFNSVMLEHDKMSDPDPVKNTAKYLFSYIKEQPKTFTLTVNDKGASLQIQATVQRRLHRKVNKEYDDDFAWRN